MSASWRPKVVPRVRWRFVYVQAREVLFVWHHRLWGSGAPALQGVFLRLRGPGGGMAKAPSRFRRSTGFDPDE